MSRLSWVQQNLLVLFFGTVIGFLAGSSVIRRTTSPDLYTSKPLTWDDDLLLPQQDGTIHLRPLPPTPYVPFWKRNIPNWRVLSRVKADRERRCAMGPAWPVGPDDPKGFAIVFLVVRHIDTRLTWERWLQDAYDWIHAEGLEASDIPPHKSSILRTYVSFHGAFDRDKVKELMTPLMKESPIKDPQMCPWSLLGPCYRQLMEYPYNDWPHAGYFLIMSHNSVPVKPFSTMYRSFLADRRARTTTHNIAFDPDSLCPKGSTWKGLPREMVRPMVERSHWVLMDWMHQGKAAGSVDEGQHWIGVMAEYGEGFAEMFHPGKMAGVMPPWPEGDSLNWHVDCWPGYSFHAPHCTALGTDSHDKPRKFHTVLEAGVLELLNNSHVWSFRKVLDTTLVKTKVGPQSGM
eukprot:Blabericola_migrator_1__4709@NODE_2486_length_2692_cov_46_669714_g1558_i0_p1_GENE_NODE_2486_length_2692_cov_46_669714_g1558_i0NODE_2486_length_2692_cov_46_669714_g1558_i0_p1_ORF_typecomplete_len403_score42_48Branch/PF02485_21/3_3e05_NODE_2486_length_2692_cov_46_669714_g1558_i0831291